jgi:hypothetical protein
MTEEEWLAATEPELMLEFLKQKMSARRLRLLACGCCRRLWNRLTWKRHEASRRVVELVEAVADGDVSELQLPDACEKAQLADQYFNEYETRACALIACPISENLGDILSFCSLAFGENSSESTEQCSLIRCIFGNPFRPATINRSWLTSTVIALAQQMYDTRDFSAMPILADALQDANCDNLQILEHCRGPGPHCRGCWVVDACLSKE